MLNELNNSLWDVDFYDWITVNPYPIIPSMEIRVASNVSIRHEYNITLATLELYKGNKMSEFLSDEQNAAPWIQVSETNRTFAFIKEETGIISLDAGFTWIFLQFLNKSNNNTVKMRLRYQTNVTKGDPDWAFNVSINHVSINFYIQNAYTSDIASTIGLGLRSAFLTPTLIKMQNFGTNITNNGYQKGIWDNTISDGVPQQGFYEFNITSIWPEIKFDLVGIYKIERQQAFQWEYQLSETRETILWNISADFLYYTYYNVIKESRSLNIIVPSNWKLMEVFNYTNLTPITSGGWYTDNITTGLSQIIFVYNISDGIWKIGMNSSMSVMYANYSASGEIKIDQILDVNVSIPNHYGGDVSFEVYNEAALMIFSNYDALNKTLLENSTFFNWDISESQSNTGKHYLKTY